MPNYIYVFDIHMLSVMVAMVQKNPENNTRGTKKSRTELTRQMRVFQNNTFTLTIHFCVGPKLEAITLRLYYYRVTVLNLDFFTFKNIDPICT